MYLQKVKNKLNVEAAFTLIELLIVISIIAVLSVFVFVTLDPAKRFSDARNSKRSNSVNTIVEAIKLYQIDNDGSLPPGIDGNLRMLGTDSNSCNHLCGANDASSSAVVETFSVRVVSSTDDAEERNPPGGFISRASTDLELVDDATTEQEVGLRFRSVTIPQGSNIVSAYIDFVVDEIDSGTTNLIFYGQDADDANNFSTTYGDISSRTRTSSSVSWSNISSWDLMGEVKTSPNLGSIVQEIVDRPGWTSGNNLVFIITGSGERTAEAYDGSSVDAPFLRVEYTDSSSGAGGMLSVGETETSCLDLSSELAPYLATIPFDDNDGNSGKTYYAVQAEGNIEGAVTVYSCNSELGEIISVTK